MSNPSSESQQSTRYVFPPRAVIVQGDEASNPPRKRFRLFWGQFIESVTQKAPLDRDILYALDLFNQIEFNVSQEKFHRLENMLSTAVLLSENPLSPKSSDKMYWACESTAIDYFDVLYSPENHSSQVHPATLSMIAKYLFAVLNVPKGRAKAFSGPYIGLHLVFGVGENSHRALHEKASAAIGNHWWAWNTGEIEAAEQAEYAQAPEAPIQPAEPLETPDMDALMRRAFAAFEEGKPLAEAGMVVCDAFGLREVYEEQLKDPKNRAILALGETLLRTVQSVLRPSAPPEKPFVMSAPPEDTARPRTPADPPAAPLMSDVVKDMIEKQQQHHAEKMAEINAAYRQRDEQIRQAKAIADAECQDALDRISRGYAKGEEGVWLPLVGHAQQAYAPPDAWEGFRKQALNGDKHLAQILADLKAKADEQHELSEKIREQFAGKGDDPIEKLRKRIVYGKNKGN